MTYLYPYKVFYIGTYEEGDRTKELVCFSYIDPKTKEKCFYDSRTQGDDYREIRNPHLDSLRLTDYPFTNLFKGFSDVGFLEFNIEPGVQTTRVLCDDDQIESAIEMFKDEKNETSNGMHLNQSEEEFIDKWKKDGVKEYHARHMVNIVHFLSKEQFTDVYEAFNFIDPDEKLLEQYFGIPPLADHRENMIDDLLNKIED